MPSQAERLPLGIFYQPRGGEVFFSSEDVNATFDNPFDKIYFYTICQNENMKQPLTKESQISTPTKPTFWWLARMPEVQSREQVLDCWFEVWQDWGTHQPGPEQQTEAARSANFTVVSSQRGAGVSSGVNSASSLGASPSPTSTSGPTYGNGTPQDNSGSPDQGWLNPITIGAIVGISIATGIVAALLGWCIHASVARGRVRAQTQSTVCEGNGEQILEGLDKVVSSPQPHATSQELPSCQSPRQELPGEALVQPAELEGPSDRPSKILHDH